MKYAVTLGITEPEGEPGSPSLNEMRAAIQRARGNSPIVNAAFNMQWHDGFGGEDLHVVIAYHALVQLEKLWCEKVERMNREPLAPFVMKAGHQASSLCGAAANEILSLRQDAARYRFLRNTFFTRDFAVPADFTGEVIVSPPRAETFVEGISITRDAMHSQFLDDVIDAALSGHTAGLYKPIDKAGNR